MKKIVFLTPGVVCQTQSLGETVRLSAQGVAQIQAWRAITGAKIGRFNVVFHSNGPGCGHTAHELCIDDHTPTVVTSTTLDGQDISVLRERLGGDASLADYVVANKTLVKSYTKAAFELLNRFAIGNSGQYAFVSPPPLPQAVGFVLVNQLGGRAVDFAGQELPGGTLLHRVFFGPCEGFVVELDDHVSFKYPR